MKVLADLNLIHILDFYFSLIFFLGTLRRWGQYQAVGKLVLASPSRWPRLLNLVKDYRALFLTWGNAMPGLLALGLSVLQLIASRAIWPEAGKPPDGLTPARLLEHWPFLLIIGPLGLAMFGLDIYGLIVVGELNRAELEKHFDQAEFWLRSKKAHVVRIFTLGYINPRRMVAEEVRKALLDVSAMLNTSLYWSSIQIGLRFAFGLSLWLTWVILRT